MIGALAGDTIGSVYEFHNTKDYHFPLFHESSNYTDDSVMTMAVAWKICVSVASLLETLNCAQSLSSMALRISSREI